MQGPAYGGTTVTVRYNNLPAFVLPDISVVVGDAGNTVRASVLTLALDQGSSLLSNAGTLSFVTPMVRMIPVCTNLVVFLYIHVYMCVCVYVKHDTFQD